MPIKNDKVVQGLGGGLFFITLAIIKLKRFKIMERFVTITAFIKSLTGSRSKFTDNFHILRITLRTNHFMEGWRYSSFLQLCLHFIAHPVRCSWWSQRCINLVICNSFQFQLPNDLFFHKCKCRATAVGWGDGNIELILIKLYIPYDS